MTVSNRITDWWPEPVIFDDEAPRQNRQKHLTGPTTWHQRERPSQPLTAPWNGPLDAFLDYLTGTVDAPALSQIQEPGGDNDWGDDGGVPAWTLGDATEWSESDRQREQREATAAMRDAGLD